MAWRIVAFLKCSAAYARGVVAWRNMAVSAISNDVAVWCGDVASAAAPVVAMTAQAGQRPSRMTNDVAAWREAHTYARAQRARMAMLASNVSCNII